MPMVSPNFPLGAKISNIMSMVDEVTIILIILFFMCSGKPNRRLSVGALVNMSVLKMTEFKRSSEAFKSSGVVSGPAHAFNPHHHPQRTRNKSIPIINPIVKAPNWPAYKKGEHSRSRL